MNRPSLPPIDSIAAFAQSERGRRAIGIAAALVLEGLLLLMLLTLGLQDRREPVPMADVVSFDVREDEASAPPAEAAPEELPSALEPVPRETAQAEPPQPVHLPEPVPQRPPVVTLPQAPTVPPASAAPPAEARVYGPPAPRSSRDSARVGTAPGGQPLYGAAWYRRPRDQEMRGYLSTADPGSATIACRTVADFRVEDCVVETEYPAGSGLARAVIAAAWQFRIRPPMIGGRYMVGEWVRIPVTYTVRERFEY